MQHYVICDTQWLFFSSKYMYELKTADCPDISGLITPMSIWPNTIDAPPPTPWGLTHPLAVTLSRLFDYAKTDEVQEPTDHKWQRIDSPSPRSLFVRLTVIPLPRVLMIPRRDPRGRPRFAPRPDGLGLPVTSMLLAKGRGKAGKTRHRTQNITFRTKKWLGW